MTNIFKKSILSVALAATALAGSAPAMADGYRGGYHHGGDGAGVAVAAGIFGLAIGAIIASSANHHHDERYYDGYEGDPYVQQGWAWHDGYYWDREGHRYGRDGRPYGQDDRGYARRGYGEYGGNGYRGNGYQGYGYQGYGEQRQYQGGRGY